MVPDRRTRAAGFCIEGKCLKSAADEQDACQTRGYPRAGLIETTDSTAFDSNTQFEGGGLGERVTLFSCGVCPHLYSRHERRPPALTEVGCVHVIVDLLRRMRTVRVNQAKCPSKVTQAGERERTVVQTRRPCGSLTAWRVDTKESTKSPQTCLRAVHAATSSGAALGGCTCHVSLQLLL